MARTIAQIKTQITTQIAAESALAGLNSPSQTAIWNLWAYVIATAIFIQESLWDLFSTQLDQTISNAPAWTDKWVQTESFKFQYDAVTPQIIQLNNFVPSYPTVDTTKQIISRCSVVTKSNRIVTVKVASAEPPIALTTPQLTSFQGYLDVISPAGVQYSTISYNPDQLLVGAQVFYDGQYASTISANVIAGINTYMANIEFDGFIRISALEDAIQAVPGVTDVILNNVAIRPDGTPFANTTYLLQNNTEIYNKYTMYAGYVIGETTAGHTFTNTLIFTVG